MKILFTETITKDMIRNSFFLFGVLLLLSCGGSAPESNNGSGSVSKKKTSDVELNEHLNARVGSWIEKGKECYGIIISENIKGKTIGKSVKCKVISIQPDKIKVKALEKVNLMEGVGCDKIGIGYGDTWWESEGDLFLTREEADNYLKKKNWTDK